MKRLILYNIQYYNDLLIQKYLIFWMINKYNFTILMWIIYYKNVMIYDTKGSYFRTTTATVTLMYILKYPKTWNEFNL